MTDRNLVQPFQMPEPREQARVLRLMDAFHTITELSGWAVAAGLATEHQLAMALQVQANVEAYLHAVVAQDPAIQAQDEALDELGDTLDLPAGDPAVPA